MATDAQQFAKAVESMRNIIRRDVAAGFDEPEHIAESAVEVAADDGIDADALEPLAKQFTRESLEEHQREQATWPDRTDCDRLDEAFAELEAKGIVCRQNFSCCGTCGSSEIWGEMDSARSRGLAVRGYAFYHMQDTESAVECGGLYLGYGATEEGEAAALSIAREIVAVLNAHGLETDWDGDWRYRIGVKLDWKRRRPLLSFECRRPAQPSRELFDDTE